MNCATFSASAPAPTSTFPPIAADSSTSGGPRPCWPSCKPHDGTSPHVREHRLCLLARALTEPAIPTLEEEDARRPTRERESLVGERTRIVNRIKAALARLGVRGFKPTLRKALEPLDALRTPEGTALPPNTRAELHRDMARLRFVTEQIQQIEAARSERLEQAGAGPNAMVRLLAQVVGVGLETADMLVHEILWRNLRDRRAVARYAGLTGAPDESGSKRREKGLAKGGQRPRAPRDDPTGLALSA